MKSRICLAWFGDTDASRRERPKPKKPEVTARPAAASAPAKPVKR